MFAFWVIIKHPKAVRNTFCLFYRIQFISWLKYIMLLRDCLSRNVIFNRRKCVDFWKSSLCFTRKRVFVCTVSYNKDIVNSVVNNSENPLFLYYPLRDFDSYTDAKITERKLTWKSTSPEGDNREVTHILFTSSDVTWAGVSSNKTTSISCLHWQKW